MRSLRIHITDVRVIHLHPLGRQVIVVFTMRDGEKAKEYPGSVTLPMSRVKELQLEVGDELAILAQKTKSLFHARKK